MIYPSIIVDDFFTNTENVLELANKLDYFESKDGSFPGKRTKPLHDLNNDFFNDVNSRILTVLFPNNINDIVWSANSCFQKISGKRYPHEGWVHQDQVEMTAIIYLSKHKNCGTTLWKNKKFKKANKTENIKKHFFKKQNFDKDFQKYLTEHNSNFTKILTVESFFNRMFLFDSKQLHSASNFKDDNLSSERLFFISFFSFINTNSGNLKYPLTELRRF